MTETLFKSRGHAKGGDGCLDREAGDGNDDDFVRQRRSRTIGRATCTVRVVLKARNYYAFAPRHFRAAFALIAGARTAERSARNVSVGRSFRAYTASAKSAAARDTTTSAALNWIARTPSTHAQFFSSSFFSPDRNAPR